MLRDLVLVAGILFCLWLSLRRPFAGVLAWAWLTLMQPHREAYGFFSTNLRLNLIVAIAAILAWLLSKERKLPPFDGTIVAISMFLVWMTFSAFLAVDPSTSWPQWDRNWRIIALALLVWAMATSKVRIHALIWIVVTCLLYYGIKGGILAILTGGTKKVSGPFDTLILDENHLAVALLMTLPLVNYLRLHTANNLIRLALIAGFVLSLLAVVSSYSRGGFVALAALGIAAWTRSRNKFLYLTVAVALAVPIFYFMPDAYYDRLGTLADSGNDASFQERVRAWQVAYSYARDHFPLGAGFDGPQFETVFHYYLPDEPPHAAHSIFFQVLGDTGFIGLGIYLTILFLAFLNIYKIRKTTRGKPELSWARDLATMIQLSLMAFCVGGSALSLAYYDMAFIWFAVLPPLYKLVRQTAIQNQKAPGQSEATAAAPVNARPLGQRAPANGSLPA